MCNFTPKPDFNGGHPDPNLVYAKDLVEKLKKKPGEKGATSSTLVSSVNFLIVFNSFRV